MPNNCLYFDFWFFKDSKLSVSSFTRYCKFQNVLCILQINCIRTFKQYFWHTFKKHRNSWISSSKRINCKSVSWSLQVTFNANQSGSGPNLSVLNFSCTKFVRFFWGGGRRVALIFYRSGLNFPEIQNWIVIVGNTDSPSLNWKGLDIVQRLASFLSECNYINQQAKLVFRICCNCSADIKSKSIKLQLITLFVRNACGERAELSSKIVEEPNPAF